MLTSAASIGTSLIARLFARGPQPLGPQEAVKQAVRAAVLPQRWVLGEKSVGGLLAYIGAKGRKLRLAFVLHNGPGEALLKVRVRGELVDVAKDPASALHEPAADSEYRDRLKAWHYAAADGTEGVEMRSVPSFGSGAEFTSDVIDVQSYEADPSAGTGGSWSSSYDASTRFVRVPNPDYGAFASDLGDVAEYEVYPFQTDYPLWDASHRLEGRTWVFVELDQPVWENVKARFFRRIPELEFVIRGLRHTWPGQSTPAWTRNRAAQIYWWLTERRGFAAADIDDAAFASAFATCDETVTVTLPQRLVDQGFATTSRRYHGDIVVSSGDDIDRVEAVLEAGMCGHVVVSNGKLQIRPGRDPAPVISLDDSWTLEPPTIQPWKGLEERFNAIDLTIAQSRDHEYAEYSVGRFVDTAALARDGGELRVRAIHLPDISEPIAAARIQAILLRENREARFLTGRFRPGDDFELLERVGPGDTIAYGSDALGHATANWRVLRHVVEPLSGIVTLACREELPGTYDDTLVLPELKQSNLFRPPDPTTVRVDAPTGVSVTESHEIQDDGTSVSSMTAAWANSIAPVTQLQWRSRPPVAPGGTPSWGDWSAIREVQGASDTIAIPGVTGTIWRVRVRHVYGDASASRWSVAEAAVARDTGAPGALANLAAVALPGGMEVSFDPPPDPDYSHARLYLKQGTGALNESADFHGTFATSRVELLNLAPGQPYRCWARPVDHSRNEGPLAGPVQATPLAAGSGAGGIGVERIYAKTATAALPAAQRPDDSWGYDRPGTAGGLAWTDARPAKDESNPYVWRSERLTVGQPSAGDAVAAAWSVPVDVTGLPGEPGADGADGLALGRALSRSWHGETAPTNGSPMPAGAFFFNLGEIAIGRGDERVDWPYLAAVPAGTYVSIQLDDDSYAVFRTTSIGSPRTTGGVWYDIEYAAGDYDAVVMAITPGDDYELVIGYSLGDPGLDAFGQALSRVFDDDPLGQTGTEGAFAVRQDGAQMQVWEGDDRDYLESVRAGSGVWFDGRAYRWRARITGSSRIPVSGGGALWQFATVQENISRGATDGQAYQLVFTQSPGGGPVDFASVTVPNAPASFAVAKSGMSADITWAAPDSGPEAEGWILERSQDGSFFSLLETLPVATLSHTDTGLEDGETYTYRLAGYNQFGNSEYTSQIAISFAALGRIAFPIALSGIELMTGDIGDTRGWKLNDALTEIEVLVRDNRDQTINGVVVNEASYISGLTVGSHVLALLAFVVGNARGEVLFRITSSPVVETGGGGSRAWTKATFGVEKLFSGPAVFTPDELQPAQTNSLRFNSDNAAFSDAIPAAFTLDTITNVNTGIQLEFSAVPTVVERSNNNEDWEILDYLNNVATFVDQNVVEGRTYYYRGYRHTQTGRRNPSPLTNVLSLESDMVPLDRAFAIARHYEEYATTNFALGRFRRIVAVGTDPVRVIYDFAYRYETSSNSSEELKLRAIEPGWRMLQTFQNYATQSGEIKGILQDRLVNNIMAVRVEVLFSDFISGTPNDAINDFRFSPPTVA